MSNNFEKRILSVMRGKNKPPMSPKELAKKVGVKKNKKEPFLAAIADLVAENKLIESGSKYLLVENLKLLPAQIVKVNATFGFARLLEGGDQDVFVPGRRLLGAMPGDTVMLRKRQSQGQLPEGEVLKITHQERKRFSGVLRVDEAECVIVPDSYVKFPIRINRASAEGAKDGDKIIAVLERQGNRHSDHIARMTESFGDADSAASCCRAILSANDIHTQFPPEVVEQAQSIAALSGIHPKELAARTDLREEVVFTIDGADSKDLDDAVSLSRREGGGWSLGVHIADVSYFVTHQSPLDREAFLRGTSVYYTDSVVPMLPQELSNGICSLNPGEDRLAFSALMELDGEGNLESWQFVKTVIRSRVKGVYDEVNKILKGSKDKRLLKKYDGLVDTILLMEELAGVLTAKRFGRGGLNLESVESKIKVGPDGKAVDVVPRVRGASEMIIEEFMLTANEAAARFAKEKALPFVYRVHENPAPDKVSNLFEVVERLGIKAKRPKGPVTVKQLSAVLDKARNTPASRVVNTMVLRSMAKAKYAEQPMGHFGLALADYTHFTSPIRRYPDLTIHRILSGCVTGMRMDNIKKRYSAFVVRSAARSTEREIIAMTAERGCEDCYKAEYMSALVGQEFDGVITGTTSFGVYVQLENTVEGLVALRDIPGEDWEFDGSIALVSRVGGKRLQLGDEVRIRVLSTQVAAGQIDFGLVETEK